MRKAPLLFVCAAVLLAGCNADKINTTSNNATTKAKAQPEPPAVVLVNSPMYFGPWSPIGNDSHTIEHKGKQFDVIDNYLIRKLWYETTNKDTGEIVDKKRLICMQIIIQRDAASPAVRGRVGEYNVDCTNDVSLFSGHVALSEIRSPFFDNKVKIALKLWKQIGPS